MSFTVARPGDLVAHRGNAHEFPENTLPALRSALELGVGFVEFDVHLSADRVPVVMHDANLLRCGGIDRDGLTMSAAELQQISVGEASRFGGRFAEVTIPLLSDVAGLLRQFPHAKAFVELKRASLQRFGTELLVERISQALRPVISQVIVISFDLPAVSWARQVMRTPIGWVLPSYDTQNAIKAEAVLPEYLFCDVAKIPAQVQRLWHGPWRWASYEITEQAQVERLSALGVRLLETMQVRRLQQQLAELQPPALDAVI